MSGRGYIAVEPDTKCEFCGKVSECRPYGPNKESICFDCAMRDEEMTQKRMRQHVFGEDLDS